MEPKWLDWEEEIDGTERSEVAFVHSSGINWRTFDSYLFAQWEAVKISLGDMGISLLCPLYVQTKVDPLHGYVTVFQWAF